jgi:F-type H+-transporting ATPase subunit b
MEHHIDTMKLVFQFINFAVLLFILIKFGGKGIKEMLANRHFELKKNVEESQVLREQAEAKLKELEARLAGLDSEVAQIVAGLRKEAEAEKAAILRAAAQGAERLKADAERSIADETVRIERRLRKEVVAAAVDMAKELLGKKSEADERRLQELFLRKLALHPAGQPTASKPPTVPDLDWEVNHGA